MKSLHPPGLILTISVLLFRGAIVFGQALPPVPPPPAPAPTIPAPPAPPIAPATSGPTTAQIQRMTPSVELWRASASSPQVPKRNGRYMDFAYVTGNQPVILRLQFDPAMAGKKVVVSPGRGISFEPPAQVLQVRPTGECVISVKLDENVPRGQISFYCEGLDTVVPLLRGTMATVVGKEAASQGRGQ